MAPVFVDPAKVCEFSDADSFYRWLAQNHSAETEVWIKIHKVGSGLSSITPLEAIDVVLCWGWIDAIRKGLDKTSYLQRYTPRGRKSIWSRINVDNVARLIQEGRMTEHGLREVDAASPMDDGPTPTVAARTLWFPKTFGPPSTPSRLRATCLPG